MPEWLIERGIGEVRAALVERGEILEARILPDGRMRAGTVLQAKLLRIGPPCIAMADGIEYLMPKRPPATSEGSSLTIEVSREKIDGPEAWKRPLAMPSDRSPSPAPALEGRDLAFPSPRDELGEAGWGELIDEARSGSVGFSGGELRISVTPAMTLIDVDGTLPIADLAMAGAKAAARAIRRHDVGGSIGIDLPTIGGKEARQAIGSAVDAILPPPFERTAVNGFGFIQIVRPRRRASLFELAANRPSFEARALLRLAARSSGAIRLVAHPAVIAAIQPDWISQLAGQVGGAVDLRSDPAMAMSASYVETA
ncbi:ribonuclease [Sphingomonas sp. LY29]|uniref:ribonuclease n=1 Tax=Sphingomonas sp. LY29 TaxID=3095341 RepID=UPI002D789D7C|nr:ribonuclease [Sphingomonas sp. LY29]WRP24737.1 ribonuclease [Sphingomonas sp. LY29]